MTQKKKKTKKRLAVAAIVLLFLAAAGLFGLYHVVLQPNLDIEESAHVYIPTGSSFDNVLDLFEAQGLLKSKSTFTWLAIKKKYPSRIMPGRYLLHKRMGNNELINLLRSGKQDPVSVTFNNIRTKQQLASSISKQIEADSASIIRLLSDREFLSAYEMTPETSMLLFIPNTYEFFWNTSAEQLFIRMQREYNRFWNDNRTALARQARLTPKQAMILASIVERETSKVDEMSRIAGVYINRLNRNMLLQADPTVVYASGDFTLRRVLHRHLAIDSPYNTYKYAGLPPGPIGLPGPRVIDRVLNYEKHDYLFFCAKDDFSGYHAFARTYSEHLVNARRFQQALNRANIMR